MPITAVGLFRDKTPVESAASEIEALGFPRNRVRAVGEPLDFAITGVMSIPHVEFELDLTRELIRIGANTQEAGAYVDGIRHGGVLLFVTGKDGKKVDASAAVMNNHGATQVAEVGGPEPVLPSRTRMGASPHYDAGIQTGRSRQESDGARLFTW